MGISKTTGGVPARVILGVLSFFMFLVTQMIRANLYIAIVSMVQHGNNTTTSSTSPSQSLDWNDYNISWLLGAFYFCYWMTELPGGLLAQRYGGRRVLGVSVFLAGLLNLLQPLACWSNYWVAVVVRALQGFALGVTWPAMHSLSAHWIPAIERSKFMTSYYGAAVGSAIVYPLSGVLMSTLGWEYVYYMTGGLTLVWSVAWWYLVFDSPAEHPRISKEERTFLAENIGKSVDPKRGLSSPWSKILTSTPFWALLVASQGVMWGTITLSMQLPTYFNTVHGLDYKTNGLMCALPELCKFLFGLCFSSFIDWSLRSGKFSFTVARKIAISINEYVTAALVLLLAFVAWGNFPLEVTLLVLATASTGTSSSGNLANVVDLSPNFAGTLLGLIKTTAVIPGVLSPYITTQLIDKQGIKSGWQYVFLIIAVVHICCCSIYLAFGTGEVQFWNTPEVKDDSEKNGKPSELIALKEERSVNERD